MSNIQRSNTEITLIPLPLRNTRAGYEDTPLRDAVLDLVNEAINSDYTIQQRHAAITQRLSDLQSCIVRAATTLSTSPSMSTLDIRLILLDASEARDDIAEFPSYMMNVNEKYNIVALDFLKETTSEIKKIAQSIKDDILDTHKFP